VAGEPIFRHLPQSLAITGTPVEAIVNRFSLEELRQRYVIEGRPLETSLEEMLRADGRAGARSILVD
jgi:hypothetical protein